ncbi:MAG: ABC transporter ATP-binding protein [Christensenellales bacterium]|jgi:branched-chain amino acid transport system ATP-binding protein
MLTVEHLTMEFGGLIANNDITLTVDEGRITGLIGPNGAGKTTFFNVVNGVYKPNSGTINFLGKRIDGLQPFEVNQLGISRTYQVINLFKKMSVMDNVMVGMHSRMKQGFFASMLKTKGERKEEEECRERAYEWLEFVELKDRAFEQAGALSYGEQRRLEIVRGLASSPKLILLDEPAAGMNTREKESLNELLDEIVRHGVTILIIEHDMKMIMNVADYIYVLNYGKKLAQGTPEEVQNNPEVIAAYLGED